MNSSRYQNEKMKRKFFELCKEADGYSDKTLKVIESSIWKYEEYTKQEDFKKFNSETAKGFKKWLSTKKNAITKQPLSLTSQYKILRHVNKFFYWLVMQPGYKSKVKMDDVNYLKLSKAESRMATSPKLPNFPSINYILRLCSFEVKDDIDRRDRAMIAFTALSGMRDLAIISLPLGCFDALTLLVDQNPNKGVQTKFSKTIYTTLFKFDDKLLGYVLDWVKYLKEEKLFSENNPIFPATNIELKSETEQSFVSNGITKNFWKNAGPMRKVFKNRSEQMKLEYFSPHRFRHFTINYSNKFAHGAEEMKAISQNVGHERLSTTFTSYGSIDEYRVSDLISQMNFVENKMKDS